MSTKDDETICQNILHNFSIHKAAFYSQYNTFKSITHIVGGEKLRCTVKRARHEACTVVWRCLEYTNQ